MARKIQSCWRCCCAVRSGSLLTALGKRTILATGDCILILLNLTYAESHQVAVSDKQVFGATVEGLETISHLISRYAIFEDLYMQRNTAVSSELEAMLTGLYADVLVFLAKAKKYFQTSTAGK